MSETDEARRIWPRRKLPVIPRLPPDHPEDQPGNRAVAVCGECGRTVHQFEHYACQRDRCPVQPKARFG